MKHLHWVAEILFGSGLCMLFWGIHPLVGLMFGLLFGILIYNTYGILNLPWSIMLGALIWGIVMVFTTKEIGAFAGIVTFMVVGYKFGPKPERPPEPTQRFHFR